MDSLKGGIYFLLLTLLFFFPNIFLGKSYTPFNLLSVWEKDPSSHQAPPLEQSEALVIFYANDSLYNKMLKDGEVLKWNPYIFSGYPVYANGHSAFYNPFRLFFNRFFSPVFARDFTIFFHMFLSGFFMFMLLKEMRFGLFPSLMGGTVWEFCGHNTALIEWLWGPMASAYLPMLFFFFTRLVRNGKWYNLALTSISFSLSLMCGNLQWSLYIFLLWMGMFLFYLSQLLKEEKRKALHLSIYFCSGVVLGILLSAIELIPTIELFLHSSTQRIVLTFEGVKTDFLTKLSVISNLFYPRLLGSPFDFVNLKSQLINFYLVNGYIGVYPLFLMVCGIFIFWKDKYVKFLASVFILSWLIALRTPLLIPLLHIPIMNRLFHDRILFLASFTGTVLSTYGVRGLLQHGREKFKLMVALFFALFYISMIMIFIYTFKPYFPSLWLSLRNSAITLPFLFIVLSVVLCLMLVFRTPLILFKLFSLLLVVVDLIPLGILANARSSPKSINFLERLSEDLKTAEFYRVAGISPNLSVIMGIPSPEGFDSIYPDTYFKVLFPSALWDEMKRWKITYDMIPFNILRLLGVKYVIQNGRIPFPLELPQVREMRFKKKVGELLVYEIENPLPRAFVPEQVIFMSDDECRHTIRREEFDPSTFLILPKDSKTPVLAEKTKGNVKIVSYTPHSIKLDADMTNTGFVVLTDTYYPGWKAYIDGRKTKIYRAYSFLRAILVPKGKHIIKFVFEPFPLKIGKMVTFFTLLLMISLRFIKFEPIVKARQEKELEYYVSQKKPPTFAKIIYFCFGFCMVLVFMDLKLWITTSKELGYSRWHYYKGLCELQLNREMGISELKRALSFKTKELSAYAVLGRVFLENKNDVESLKILESAYMYVPYDPGIVIPLLSLYRKMGMREKFKEVSDKVKKFYPSWANSFENWGFTSLQNGDIQTAEKSFLTVIVLDPQKHKAYYGLSLIYAMTGEFEKSLEFLKQAISLAPKNRTYRALYTRLKGD